jgi:muconolactone delta-isomerase
MKFLVINRPKLGAKMANPLAVTKAAKTYFERMLANGKVETIFEYKDRSAYFAIFNVRSHDELMRLMKGAPGFDYENSEVHEIQDGLEAFGAVIAHLEQVTPL